jgi:hypothetical protein
MRYGIRQTSDSTSLPSSFVGICSERVTQVERRRSCPFLPDRQAEILHKSQRLAAFLPTHPPEKFAKHSKKKKKEKKGLTHLCPRLPNSQPIWITLPVSAAPCDSGRYGIDDVKGVTADHLSRSPHCRHPSKAERLSAV